ncbi:hypothetical protein SprV_0200750000 [Sparganum proliferum]
MEIPSPELLVHIYDEIAESQVRLPKRDYEKYLVKWGVAHNKAADLCSMADPDGNGYITRDELCSTLNCWPDRPRELNDVKVLQSDMPLKQRESMILLICDCANKRGSKHDIARQIKKRVEAIYGDGWNVLVVDGRFWLVQAHKPGSNLVFVYKNLVYGISQAPGIKDHCQ